MSSLRCRAKENVSEILHAAMVRKCRRCDNLLEDLCPAVEQKIEGVGQAFLFMQQRFQLDELSLDATEMLDVTGESIKVHSAIIHTP